MFLVKIIPYPRLLKKGKNNPYLRLKQLENHTLKYGTYPYSLYIGVPSPLSQKCVSLSTAIFCVMSPFVINVPTRDLLVPCTERSFQILWLQVQLALYN